MLEGNVLVAGGGAVEVALSAHLENYALSVNTREQVVIAENKYVDGRVCDGWLMLTPEVQRSI